MLCQPNQKPPRIGGGFRSDWGCWVALLPWFYSNETVRDLVNSQLTWPHSVILSSRLGYCRSKYPSDNSAGEFRTMLKLILPCENIVQCSIYTFIKSATSQPAPLKARLQVTQHTHPAMCLVEVQAGPPSLREPNGRGFTVCWESPPPASVPGH